MSIFKWRTPLALVAVLCIAGLTACAQQASSGAAGQTSASSSSGAAASGSRGSSGQSGIYGKVTAVDGSKITLALGTMNRSSGGRTGSQGTASGGGRPGTSPNGKNGASGTPGEADGSSPNSRGAWPRMGAAITLSGKTTAITISDPSVVKRMSRGERKPQSGGADSSASLSDIKVGAILSVVENSGGKITSVMILSDPSTQSAQ